MINITSSTLIQQPLKRVFDFVSQPENDFQWRTATLASAWVSEGHTSLGTFFRSLGHLLGYRNLGTFEVTEYEPETKFGFKSLSGPLHLRTLCTFELATGGTRLTISTQISAVELPRVPPGILEKQLMEQTREDLALLKHLLEAG